MSGQAEQTLSLAALLERHRDEIATAWAELAQQLPPSSYQEQPLNELKKSAQYVLRALITILVTDSCTGVESHLTERILTHLRLGFDLGELVHASLLVKEATLPFIIKAYASGSGEAYAAIAQFDVCLRRFIGLYGYLYGQVMQRHVQEQQERTALMLEAAQMASSSLDLDQVLARIAEVMAAAVGVRHCGIFLVDAERGHLIHRTGIGKLTKTQLEVGGHRLPDLAGSPLVRELLEWREPVVCTEAETDPRINREITQPLGLKSVLVVPLGVGERVLGVVFLGSHDQPQQFTPEQIELAWGMAKAVALAVENARLYEETRRRLAESQSLQRVTAALLQKLNLEQILEIVCAETQELTEATGSAVCLLEPGRNACLRVTLSRETPAPAFERRPTLGWIADLVIRRGQPVLDNAPTVEDACHCGAASLTALLAVPLRVDGTIIGVLNVVNKPGGFNGDDLRLIGLFADQAAIAIENARLHQQAEQLAVLKERNRVARELHDSTTQALYTVTLYAEAAVTKLRAGNTVGVVDHLRELRDAAREALREIRLLIFELRPPLLAEEGLVGALQARLEMVEARAGFQTELRVSGEKRLPLAVEEELYRIAQEALNNAVKHARARRVTVELQFTDDAVSMEVSDDGVGFDPASANEKGGWGLRGMTERARRIGGQLAVESIPGQGTRVRFKLETQGLEEEARRRRGTQPLSQLFPGPPSVDQAPSVAQPPIRVLVADDHVIVRQGLRALLTAQADIEVVGEAGSGAEAVAQAAVLHPEVILMDLVMPGLDGIEAIRQITARQPEIRLLVLTSFSSDDKVFPALKAGALGYLLKDSGPEELVQAIRQVYRGESSLHPAVARKVLRELTHPTGHQPPTVEPLTEREVAVLRLVTQGQTNRQIAEQLVVTETTVRSHVSHILRKLHLASRTQAVLYALHEGLASPDTPLAEA